MDECEGKVGELWGVREKIVVRNLFEILTTARTGGRGDGVHRKHRRPRANGLAVAGVLRGLWGGVEAYAIAVV